MKQCLRFLPVFALTSFLCLTSYAAEQDAAKSEDVKQAIDAVEAETGIILDYVTAVSKKLDEFEKDFNAARAAGKIKEDTLQNVQPAQVIAQARAELQLAEQYGVLAQQKTDAAKGPHNPAETHVNIKDAMDKADMARKLASRVNSALGGRGQEQGAQAPPAVRRAQIGATGRALEQLLEAFRRSGEGHVYAAFGDSGLHTTDAVIYADTTQMLTAPNGRSVKVTTLNGLLPGGRQPLFHREPPSPVDRKPRVVPSEALVNAISSPDFQKQREVGGVDLNVTLDLLSFLKVSGFAKLGPATIVDSPVLISLKELHKQASRYAGAWKDMPERLRYPGEVERLHGFVLDPKNDDVFLIAARARSREARLDIDSLIVGLRIAWLQGQTPGVSLDPTPDDPGGPQYVRVLSAPRDSSFTKIMLEADYAMKRIILGEMTVKAAEFKTLPQVLGGKPWMGASRVWLFPIPMGADDIRVSDSARSVIFESGVQVLTASRRAVDGRYEDTGKRDETSEKVANLFTASYDEFERSTQIEPRGIYVQLHALIDIVTISKIMRDMGIDYPPLRDFCNLPYARLQVPNYYRGVKATYGSSDGITTISGGVDVRVRAGDHSIGWYHDSKTEALEHAVDSFTRGKEFSASIPLKLVLPKPGGDTGVTAENLRVKGQAAFALKQYEAARDWFLEATKADPFYSEAFVDLAKCYSLLGQHRKAVETIGRAIALEPGDARLNMLALEIELLAHPKLDLDRKDESVRQLLSTEYVNRAFNDLQHRRNDDARKEADTAIRLWDENADAFFVRALTYADLTSPEADRDLLQAIRQYKKLARKGGDAETNLQLAKTMAWHASGRFARIQKTVTADGITEANVRWLLDESARAADEAHEARLIDDAEPDAIVTEALARAVKVELLKATGQDGDIANARGLADLAVKRFPDFSHAHTARSYVLNVAGASDEAVSEMGEAIRLDPTYGPLFLQRAGLYLERHSFAEAKADLERAKALGAKVNPYLEKKIRESK